MPVSSRLLTSVLPLALAIGGVMPIAAAGAADAAYNPACVTKAEFRSIHPGQTRTRVTRITGVDGRAIRSARHGSGRTVLRDYRPCPEWNLYSVVQVMFRNHRAGGPMLAEQKSAFWIHN